MVNKKFWLGILVIALVFGMTLVGCEDETPTDFTITFDANGGKWDDGSTTKSVKVKHGTTADQKDLKGYVRDPIRQGYTFKQWTTAANSDPNNIYIVSINTDGTLYALWVQN